MQARGPLDAIGIITCGRVGFAETFRNIFESSAPLKYGVHVVSVPYWAQGLTIGVKTGLASGAKYLLFYDGDGAWEPQDLLELYALIERDDKCDAIFPYQADRFGIKPLVHNWLPDKFGPYDFDQPLIKYPHGHFGLTLIRSEVFRNLPEPWFWDQPGKDGSWDLNQGKMDADTHFWLKLHQLYDHTGHYNLLATRTCIGHIELVIRWQAGPKVICQTIPEFREHGKPYDCRYPRPEEYGPQDDQQPDGSPASMPTDEDAARVAAVVAEGQAAVVAEGQKETFDA